MEASESSPNPARIRKVKTDHSIGHFVPHFCSIQIQVRLGWKLELIYRRKSAEERGAGVEMAGRLIYERLGPQPRLIMAKSVCRKSAVTERGGEGCVESRAGLHCGSVDLKRITTA